MAKTKIKYHRKTGAKIDTPDIRPVLGKPLQFFLDHLKKEIYERIGKVVIVSASEIEVLSEEIWNYNYIARIAELLHFENEINYYRLRQRYHFQYAQGEALLRLSEVVKLGYLDLPNNKQVLIHLRYKIDSYPVMLSLVHSADMNIRLSVLQVYNKRYWAAGTLFIL
ncbi:MAG: hypothetical protein KBB70_02340 [Candidatus Pacebacteria bacterium]|jgi:hypothetical protein|nr:hypothetical protein [Candidatus Paceibacterota bacterium]